MVPRGDGRTWPMRSQKLERARGRRPRSRRRTIAAISAHIPARSIAIQPSPPGTALRTAGCAKSATISSSSSEIAVSSAAHSSVQQMTGCRVVLFTLDASTVGTIMSVMTELVACSSDRCREKPRFRARRITTACSCQSARFRSGPGCPSVGCAPPAADAWR